MIHYDDTVTCLRCGKCCYLAVGDVKKKCKFLVRLSNGKTLCRIYNRKDRIGTYIGCIGDIKFYCNFRRNLHVKIDGCPYNDTLNFNHDNDYEVKHGKE